MIYEERGKSCGRLMQVEHVDAKILTNQAKIRARGLMFSS